MIGVHATRTSRPGLVGVSLLSAPQDALPLLLQAHPRSGGLAGRASSNAISFSPTAAASPYLSSFHASCDRRQRSARCREAHSREACGAATASRSSLSPAASAWTCSKASVSISGSWTVLLGPDPSPGSLHFSSVAWPAERDIIDADQFLDLSPLVPDQSARTATRAARGPKLTGTQRPNSDATHTAAGLAVVRVGSPQLFHQTQQVLDRRIITVIASPSRSLIEPANLTRTCRRCVALSCTLGICAYSSF